MTVYNKCDNVSIRNHICDRKEHIKMRLNLDKKKIAVIMAKKELSLSQIAEKMGTTLQAVVRLMSNTAGVLPTTVGRLAKALEVEVEEIIED